MAIYTTEEYSDGNRILKSNVIDLMRPEFKHVLPKVDKRYMVGVKVKFEGLWIPGFGIGEYNSLDRAIRVANMKLTRQPQKHE